MRPYFKIKSRNKSLEIEVAGEALAWRARDKRLHFRRHTYTRTYRATVFLCPLELGGTLKEYDNINIASPGTTLNPLIFSFLRSKLL